MGNPKISLVKENQKMRANWEQKEAFAHVFTVQEKHFLYTKW